MAKTALITGITGQDGSYLAELLLAKGYEVHGIIRRASTFNTDRIDHIYQDPHDADRRLRAALRRPDRRRRGWSTCCATIRPDEVYHLGAQSHVRVSLRRCPSTPATPPGSAPCGCSRRSGRSASTRRFYQASSLGDVRRRRRRRRTRTTPFYPRSPVRRARRSTRYWMTVNYREAYGLFAVNGILFNHESPRRGETFVTRKITRAVARIKAGLAGQRSTSATSTPCATGATRRSTSRGCGGCCSRTRPTTTCSRPATRDDGAGVQLGGASSASGSTGRSTSSSTTLPAADRGRRADRRRVQGRGAARLEGRDVRPSSSPDLMVDADVERLQAEREGRLVRVDRR